MPGKEEADKRQRRQESYFRAVVCGRDAPCASLRGAGLRLARPSGPDTSKAARFVILSVVKDLFLSFLLVPFVPTKGTQKLSARVYGYGRGPNAESGC